MTDEPLIPLRMLNAYVYCPRLAYLEWVQGEWAESVDTLEGKWVHRRVDEGEGEGARLDWQGQEREVRSVSLSSPSLGLVGRIDLVELAEGVAVPVEYKKGRRPHTERRFWDPEGVQLCAQGMLLREHGFACSEGVIYFAGSRERVRVPFDERLEDLTHMMVAGIQAFTLPEARIPPPLEEDRKCVRCALAGICLPEEVNHLNNNREIRRVVPPREDAVPFYVQEPGARVRKNGGVLEVWRDGEKLAGVALEEIAQVVLLGPVEISTPAMHELFRRGIPVSYHTGSGWFLGYTAGVGHKNVEIRTAQYEMSFDPSRCLALGKTLVQAKIANSRTLLRRNARGTEGVARALGELAQCRQHCASAQHMGMLLGYEGAAAGIYFRNFPTMFADSVRERFAFDFAGRQRRPPPDPVNVMLSFGYAMLTREWTVALTVAGLDPYRGFYHQPRFGRPSLALDMMEPFRPLIADSTVIMALNNGEIKEGDFLRTSFGCSFTPSGKKAFIRCFERRMAQEITHPVFGYKVSYRTLLQVQARLLGRYLLGEIGEYPAITPR